MLSLSSDPVNAADRLAFWTIRHGIETLAHAVSASLNTVFGAKGDPMEKMLAQQRIIGMGRDDSRAAVTLTAAAPQISRLGGSRAQNELFELISQEARWRAEGTSVFTHQRAA